VKVGVRIAPDTHLKADKPVSYFTKLKVKLVDAVVQGSTDFN